MPAIERENRMNVKRMTGLFAVAFAFGATVYLDSPSALAAASSYTFELLAKVGDPLPAGGTFVNDFEGGAISPNGDVAFGADVSTGGEGVFVLRGGTVVELARSGGAAPGGGTYSGGFLGAVAQNDQGDVVYDFILEPFTLPVGVNSGAYRRSRATGALLPIVVPFVTPVPGGGTFQGTSFQPTINNRGDVAFGGVVQTNAGIHVPGEPYGGLGIGLFLADRRDRITALVKPGDPAPGGGTFDFAYEAWINDGGDIAFVAHVAGEEAAIPGFPPQSDLIDALTSLYVRDSGGTIRSVAHAGDPAPGGGVFRQVPFLSMNNRGDIAFIGDLTPAPDVYQALGVFVASGGQLVSVARPGDPMPGGGHFVSASSVNSNSHVNNVGDVVFSATLDSDTDADGTLDTAVFVWAAGRIQLIARSGSVIPGVGTIYQFTATSISFPPPPTLVPIAGLTSNDAGQVIFEATLTDGSVVLLKATPSRAK
jgi:hypothetical protein